MEIDLISVAATFLGVVGGGGVAWGSARTRIRVVEKTADALDVRVTEHNAADVLQHTIIVQRLTRIETLLEQINKRV
jgi:hypothetical protein